MSEAFVVFGILAITIILFVSDKMRLDLIALMSLLALSLTGILTPKEALAGFADPLVIMIAGLFVVSGGMFQTGLAEDIGKMLGKKAGESEAKLLLLVMGTSALMSGFMSNTGTVAVMLPITMSLAWSAGVSPSKLLMPVAFGAGLGGMITLIGTPPNVVVSAYLESKDLPGFNFFAFAPIGGTLVVVGLLFMLFVGRKMLPARAPSQQSGSQNKGPSLRSLAQAYGLSDKVSYVSLPADSPLVGMSIGEAMLRSKYRTNVLSIVSPPNGKPNTHPGGMPDLTKATSRPVVPEMRLQAGDTLILQGTESDIAAMVAGEKAVLLEHPDAEHFQLTPDMGLVEVILPTRSRMIGKTMREWRFRDRYRVTAVALRRGGLTYVNGLGDMPLKFGDSLLVKGPWAHIRLLRDELREFVVASMPREGEQTSRNRKQAPVALGVMAVMLLLMTFEVIPTVIAVLLATVAMVLGRCLTMEEAYRSISWESVVLIAAILPMATALDKTGGMQMIVNSISGLNVYGPYVMLGVIFLITSGLSQVMSNTATSVLLAPIAFESAQIMNIDPHAFLMTVAIAASTAFATPVASPTNTLVLGPGQYKFMDYAKVGLLMQVFLFIVSVFLIPLVFPF